ncbi:MAG TPA: hypothetical protein VF658_01460 [Pyrinomonadaceae bacterium]|jgi:hypothetical protein
MKRCPTCQRTFTDDSQKFCANDGTPLVADEAPAFDPEATVMSSASQIKEEEASSKPSSDALPPTQYFTPGSQPGSQAEQNIHQSYPPPSPTPGGQPAPAWPPTPPPQPQQQQPYYPQQGMAGGQPAPQWQGGQPQQQQPWMPPGQQQQPQGQNWGGGYNQPGQYAPYGASPVAKGGSSKVGTIALILGIISFISIVAVFIIANARISELRDFIEPLFWGSGALAGGGLVLGVIGLIMRSGKAKAIIGMVLSIITLGLFFLIYANMR